MFSIVIPLYNKELSVLNTINSVLNQSFNDFELIIVNDGSTDSSLQIVRSIMDERIKVFDISNGGVSKARNFGIQRAQFDLIALLDADDIWLPDFLWEMNRLVKDFPLASLYGSTSSFFSNEKIVKRDYGLKSDFRGYILNYFDLNNYNTLFDSSSVVFRKKDFFTIGAFDENLKIGEDIDLWFRFALHYKLAFINKTLSLYVQQSENRASSKVHKSNVSLINKLEKFREYELANSDFKNFLDTWRLHCLINYYDGNRIDNINVSKVLNEINISRLSKFWRIFKYCPDFFKPTLYKLQKIYKNSK